jgi:hypothetical protein
MNQQPDLNLLERLALWVLARSPRVNLMVAATSEDDMLDSLEPLSLVLERLYHAPSYGELE